MWSWRQGRERWQIITIRYPQIGLRVKYRTIIYCDRIFDFHRWGDAVVFASVWLIFVFRVRVYSITVNVSANFIFSGNDATTNCLKMWDQGRTKLLGSGCKVGRDGRWKSWSNSKHNCSLYAMLFFASANGKLMRVVYFQGRIISARNIPGLES